MTAFEAGRLKVGDTVRWTDPFNSLATADIEIKGLEFITESLIITDKMGGKTELLPEEIELVVASDSPVSNQEYAKALAKCTGAVGVTVNDPANGEPGVYPPPPPLYPVASDMAAASESWRRGEIYKQIFINDGLYLGLSRSDDETALIQVTRGEKEDLDNYTIEKTLYIPHPALRELMEGCLEYLDGTPIAQIAKDCAMFASDNFPAEEGWSHSAVDMWGAWHDKEGLLAPAMPDLFVSLYDAECEKILPELAAETRAQALPPVPDYRRFFGAFGMASSQRDQSFLALSQALNEAAKLAEPLDFEVAGAKVSNLLKGMIGHLQRSGYAPFQQG